MATLTETPREDKRLRDKVLELIPLNGPILLRALVAAARRDHGLTHHQVGTAVSELCTARLASSAPDKSGNTFVRRASKEDDFPLRQRPSQPAKAAAR